MMALSPLALLIFLFPLAYSPGPGNMFFAANGSALGFRATIPANGGYHAATWLVTLLIGVGLDSGIDRYPTAFAALKLAGAVYILRIAWRLFRSRPTTGEIAPARSTFTDGAMLLLLNPKAYVIIGLMFSQFLQPGAPNRILTVVLITTIFTANNLVSFSLWAAAGDRLARVFTSETSARRTNTALSATLVAVSAMIVLG